MQRLALSLLLVALPAFATQPINTSAGASAGASAVAGVHAQQTSAQLMQSSQQVGQSVMSSPSQNVTVTSPSASGGGSGGGTTTIRNTPDPYAPTINATVPCLVPLTVGGVGPGVGISFGSGSLDEGCELRETARLLNGLGQRLSAARLMCNNPLAAKALGAGICPIANEEWRNGVKCWNDEIIAKRMNAPVCQ